MRRFSLAGLCLGLLLFFAVGLVGCDKTPSSVDEFDIQGTMDSPSSLVVTPTLQPEFSVEYQGLESPPTIDAPSRIEVESVGDAEGSPRNGGSKRWRLKLAVDNIDQLLVQDAVLIRGSTLNGGEVVDTLSATATTSLSVQTDFASSFYTFADYEGDVTEENYELGEDFTPDEVDTDPYEGGQRNIVQSGGTEFTLTNPDPDPGLPNGDNSPAGSNGIRFMEINATSGGNVTIERRMNLPESDFFSFLVRQASTTFSLTVTMTEETGNGTASRDLSLPIPAGNQWLKVGIPFGFFGEDFNPVDSRSGGNGPLVSIRLSADGNVTYAVDEMLFGVEDTGPRAEFHDFEETNLAFGPPLTDNTYEFVTVGEEGAMVPPQSDGYTARGISGNSEFGYDTGGGLFPPPDFVKVDVDGDDVLSFLVKDQSGDTSLDVELRSSGGFFQPVTVGDFPQGEWEQVEIPIDSLGDPGVALDPGISGIKIGNQGDFLIDDIKIMPK